MGDTEGLVGVVRAVEASDRVALDLETFPPAGWREEVLAEYAKKKTKKRQQVEVRKAKLSKVKDAVYKKYAVDSDVALPRVISIATGDTNVLVDATLVDPAPLLDALKDKTLITHNGAFDLGVLRACYGYVHEGWVLDTQLLYTLYHYAESGQLTEESFGKWVIPNPRTKEIDLYGDGAEKVKMTALANVAHEHLGVLMDKESQRSDWSRPRLSPKQVEYALKDTAILLDLVGVLTRKLVDIGMGAIIELEARAYTAITDMGLNGFPADKAVAQAMADRYKTESEAALREAEALLPPGPASDGREWRITSAPHLLISTQISKPRSLAA